MVAKTVLLVLVVVLELSTVPVSGQRTNETTPFTGRELTAEDTERTFVRQLLLSVEEKVQSMGERLSNLENKLNAYLGSNPASHAATPDQAKINGTTLTNDAADSVSGFARIESKLDEVERRLTVSLEEAANHANRAEDGYGQLLAMCTLKLEHVEEIGLSVRDLIRDDMVAFLTNNFQELKDELSRGNNQQADESDEQQQQQVADGEAVVNPALGNDTAVDDKVDRSRSGCSHQPGAAIKAAGETAPFRVSDWHNASERIAEALRSGEKRIQDLDGDVKIYTRKVLNTYQELLRESKDMEVYLHEVMESNNHTRVVVRDGFRRLYQQMKPISNLEELLQSLHKKVVEIGNTVDNSFASLLVAQNTFIASCHRIQEQEPHIENRIQQLLERLVREHDSRVSNRTAQPNETFWNTFETHRKDVGRALHDLVWTVITVGNQTAEDVRLTVKNMAGTEARLCMNQCPSCITETPPKVEAAENPRPAVSDVITDRPT